MKRDPVVVSFKTIGFQLNLIEPRPTRIVKFPITTGLSKKPVRRCRDIVGAVKIAGQQSRFGKVSVAIQIQCHVNIQVVAVPRFTIETSGKRAVPWVINNVLNHALGKIKIDLSVYGRTQTKT